MIKKILVTSFLTAAIASTWIFQASKFEKECMMLSSKYLPSSASKHLPFEISYDNIAIEKYKFKVLYNKVKIRTSKAFADFYSDQISVQKFPFIEKVNIKSTSGGNKPEGVTTGFYAPNHNVIISISKPFNKIESKDFDIKSMFGKLKLVDIETDNEILHFDDYKIEVARNREKNNDNRFILSYKSDGKNIASLDNFIIYTIKRFLPGRNKDFSINDVLSYDGKDILTKIDELKGKQNSESAFTLKYNQSLLNNIKSLQKRTDVFDFLAFFALLSEDFSVESSCKGENALVKDNLTFNLINQDLVKFNLKYNI